MTDRKGRRRTEKERQMNVSTGINKFQEITMTPNRKKKIKEIQESRDGSFLYEQVTNFKIPFQQEEQSWRLHKRLWKIETDSNLSNDTQ
jgi:hypothetical protein